MEDLRILICGAGGAMGRAVTQCCAQQNVAVAAGFDPMKKGEFPFPVYNSLEDVTETLDGVIDFSHYSVTKEIADFCLSKKLPLVCATTGVDDETEVFLQQCAQEIPVFRSKNFSYGVSVMKRLAAAAASLLASDFDIELVEAHHNKKADAPSGTAQMILESVIEGAHKEYDILYGRSGRDCRRKPEEITVHALRGGSIVGEHSVIFAGADEVITLSHSALSKNVFAFGALRALRYIIGKQNGYYNMDDLVGGL